MDISATTALAPNPLRAGMRNARIIEPGVMVIFGATGDLAHRKLLPALYNLALEHPLPPQFAIVGVARRPFTDEQFRAQALESITSFSRRPVLPTFWDNFAQRLFYTQVQFAEESGYERLKALLDRLDRERGTLGNRIYYLATQPRFYGEIADMLTVAGLAHKGQREGSTSRAGKPGRREALRPQSRFRRGAQRGAKQRLPRGSDLSHRPLPRQGDGAEHHGVALRQRHLRADLEPPLHRQRPDHRRRDAGRRGARRLLRRCRGHARHGAKPHDATASAHGDGAAGDVWRGLRARREGEGAARDYHR